MTEQAVSQSVSGFDTFKSYLSKHTNLVTFVLLALALAGLTNGARCRSNRSEIWLSPNPSAPSLPWRRHDHHHACIDLSIVRGLPGGQRFRLIRAKLGLRLGDLPGRRVSAMAANCCRHRDRCCFRCLTESGRLRQAATVYATLAHVRRLWLPTDLYQGQRRWQPEGAVQALPGHDRIDSESRHLRDGRGLSCVLLRTRARAPTCTPSRKSSGRTVSGINVTKELILVYLYAAFCMNRRCVALKPTRTFQRFDRRGMNSTRLRR